MRNDDPMYVRQLEAARDAAEIEIKALEDELKRCHDIMAEQHGVINPMHMGEPRIYEAEAEQLKRPLLEKIAILRDSAKDVIAWCDETNSGGSLYCIDRLRHAIIVTTPNVKVSGLPQPDGD